MLGTQVHVLEESCQIDFTGLLDHIQGVRSPSELLFYLVANISDQTLEGGFLNYQACVGRHELHVLQSIGPRLKPASAVGFHLHEGVDILPDCVPHRDGSSVDLLLN